MATFAGSPLVFVASYTDFDSLAHAPAGRVSKFGLSVYRLCPYTGTMTLLHQVPADKLDNPGFLRYHPTRNVLYACTESITRTDEVSSLSVDGRTGRLSLTSMASSGGASACYLTVDRHMENMLCVNYWNSALTVLPLDQKTGEVGEAVFSHVPAGCARKETQKQALNRQDHLNDRQSEPHAHAIVLDPVLGRVAYVPDLGMDLVRQFVYNPDTKTLAEAGSLPSGPSGRQHGPRYICFHPALKVAYVVNELGSTVSSFRFDEDAAAALAADPTSEVNTLEFAEEVRTVPEAFDSYNCCGRIALSPCGRFLLVSNRGHNSIAVFRVDPDSGRLSTISFVHTRGKTPRHFQFDASGRWLVVANQDTDNITVFAFDAHHGHLKFVGEWEVDSPNFVCVQTPHSSHPALLRHEPRAKIAAV